MFGSNFTAADYAWSNANEALRETKDLEARVTSLERKVAELTSKLNATQSKSVAVDMPSFVASYRTKRK